MKLSILVVLALLTLAGAALAQEGSGRPETASCDPSDAFAAYQLCAEALYGANAPDQSRTLEGGEQVPAFYHSGHACSVPITVLPMSKVQDKNAWKDVTIVTCGSAYSLPNPELLSGNPKPALSPFQVSGERCKKGYKPAPPQPGQGPNNIYFEIPRITQSERNVAQAPLCKSNEAQEAQAMKEYFDSLKGKDLADAKAQLAGLKKAREHDPATMFISFSGNEPNTLASYSWAFDAYYPTVPCYLKPMPVTTDDAGMAKTKEAMSAVLASGLKTYAATLGQQLKDPGYRGQFCKDEASKIVVTACAGVGAAIASEYTALKELLANSCARGDGATTPVKALPPK